VTNKKVDQYRNSSVTQNHPELKKTKNYCSAFWQVDFLGKLTFSFFKGKRYDRLPGQT